MQRKSLSEILHNGDRDRLSRAFESTTATADFGLLPAGEYVCHVTSGSLENSKSKGTPGFKIEFTIHDGEHAKRKLWLDTWLTEAALPQAKRDLGKLGISSLDQLDRPLPRGIRCRVRVVIRTDDNGTQFNRVRSFEVVGIDEPEQSPFAPAPQGNGQPLTSKPPTTTATNADGEADGRDNPADGSF